MRMQNENVSNTGITKVNYRFKHIFSDHKPGSLLYAPNAIE